MGKRAGSSVTPAKNKKYWESEPCKELCNINLLEKVEPCQEGSAVQFLQDCLRFVFVRFRCLFVSFSFRVRLVCLFVVLCSFLFDFVFVGRP